MANSRDAEPAVVGLTRIPASDLKHRGWRGLVDLDTERALLVTNHNRPDAVIVSTAGYARLTARAAEAGSSDRRRTRSMATAWRRRAAAPNAGLGQTCRRGRARCR
jgi:prevent-host-death family protein